MRMYCWLFGVYIHRGVPVHTRRTHVARLQKTISSTEIDIPSAIYRGSISDLYDFIASEVNTFASHRGLPLPPYPNTPTRETQEEAAPDVPETSEDSATTAQHVGDSAAVLAAAATASAELKETSSTQHPCGGATDSGGADVATGAAGHAQSVSTPEATGDECGVDGIAAQLRAAVAAGVESAPGVRVASTSASGTPIGFCFSFPMKQSGLRT